MTKRYLLLVGTPLALGALGSLPLIKPFVPFVLGTSSPLRLYPFNS